MTEKRFDWDVCDGDALFYENGAVIDYDDVVELLNELHEENKSLKLKSKALCDEIFDAPTISLKRIGEKAKALREELE